MVKREIIAVIFLAFVTLALVFGNITGRAIVCNDDKCYDKDSSSTIIPMSKCFDSDMGKNYYQIGKVKIEKIYEENPNKIEYYEDECLNDKILEEYYCSVDGNNINPYEKVTRYSCPEGCIDGKCNGIDSENPKKVTLLNRIKSFFSF
jgi:hypothetical protein